jgi:hypothetical protein
MPLTGVVEPKGCLTPGLFFMGREEVPPALAQSVRQGLEPLREMTAVAGREFSGSVSRRHDMHFAVTSGTFIPRFREGTPGEASLTGGELVEVVDYDPVRHVLMAVGRAEPALAAPLHWFVYRCFPQRGACLHMHAGEGAQLPDDLKVLEVSPGAFDSRVCLTISGALKEDPVVGLGDGSVVATGPDLAGACEALLGIFAPR